MMTARFDRLLILDLDGTLIYASETPLGRAPDFSAGPYCVYKRPHLDRFLETCRAWFELAVWTSSSRAYAECIIGELFDDPEALACLLANERCTQRFCPETLDHYMVKNLHKLRRKGYSLSKMLIIDDTPATFKLNYGNGIRVSEYRGHPEDEELLDLLRFLKHLGAVEDVRRIEKRGWRYRFGNASEQQRL